MTTSIDTLAPWVQLEAAGAPANLVTDALQSVLHRFFVETEIWTTDIDVTTVEDQAEYDLTLAEGEEGVVHRIESICYLNDDDEELTPQDDSSYHFDMEAVQLVFETEYIPAADDDTVRVTVVLRPEFRGTDFPEWVLDRWGERIACGAAAKILRLPGRPYTDKERAKELHRTFLDVISEAKLEKEREGTARQTSFEA